jgi:hypothetical protein
MPQVQQETMTFLCVTFMIFVIFNIILKIILTQQNQTTRQQDRHAEYAIYVYLYTSHPQSHTVHAFKLLLLPSYFHLHVYVFTI